MATFNSLTESQRSFRELVTTSNLRKYHFYYCGASLLGNARKPNTTLDRKAHTSTSELQHNFLNFFYKVRILTLFALVSANQIGYFAGTLDSVKGGMGPSRGARSRATPKNKMTTSAPPPLVPSDSIPSVRETPAFASPEPSHPPPVPQQDKGK